LPASGKPLVFVDADAPSSFSLSKCFEHLCLFRGFDGLQEDAVQNAEGKIHSHMETVAFETFRYEASLSHIQRSSFLKTLLPLTACVFLSFVSIEAL
jgi:hypothetical protein